ncbi:hypothetical protein K443DRAFT_681643 [Laccaria amethystina LaAM-08-1]|uniref:Uncharacterized protein n=1 Tax=Laccaria amethystina LaAM-08-1 TaxID=1095629 RepID=A0A0C9WX43_9AGAR|nr:hypothetical protein K443DRAFT_681643 [Laccaria amethystina LaAM-08-1]
MSRPPVTNRVKEEVILFVPDFFLDYLMISQKNGQLYPTIPPYSVWYATLGNNHHSKNRKCVTHTRNRDGAPLTLEN